eukprot:135686_1
MATTLICPLTKQIKLLCRITSFLWTVCTYVLFTCWALRFWAIFYDLKWNVSVMNQQWICIIDHTVIDTKPPWFISHKSSFGNIRWMICRAVIPWCIFCCLWISAMTINQFFIAWKYGMISNLIFYSFAQFQYFLLLLIYCKFPSFQDNFFISKELKRIIIIYTFMEVAGIVSFFASGFTSFSSESSTLGDNKWQNIILLGCIMLYHTSATTVSMTATYWVLGKIQHIIIDPNNNRSNQIKINKFKHLNADILLDEHFRFKDLNSVQGLQLKQLFSKQRFFEVYMAHLSKEFSMHFMLALIEIIQFQQIVMEENENNLDVNQFENSLFRHCAFYKDVPLSTIVFGDNDEKEQLYITKTKANTIFSKYIVYGAEYEILLTYETRERVSEVMSHLDWIEDESIDIEQILQLFDECTGEIFSVLLDGFGRFQATQQYADLSIGRTNVNFVQ